jgi:hypothetical protein
MDKLSSGNREEESGTEKRSRDEEKGSTRRKGIHEI